MRWIFDLDGTICDTEYDIKDGEWSYIKSVPKKEIIEKINKLYDMGEHIIIFTARGSLIEENWKEITLKQLEKWGIKYNDLMFGKPGGEIYIDDRTISPEEFNNKFSFYIGMIINEQMR